MRFHPLSIACYLVVFYLSVMNMSVLPSGFFRVSDKILHTVAYGGLSFVILLELLWLDSHPKQAKIWIRGVLLPSLMGIAMEFTQAYLFPPRQGDWLDAVANVSGTLLAVGLFYAIKTPLNSWIKRIRL